MDLRAFISTSIILLPGDRILVPTGLYLEIPEKYEAQVRSRSGLALKKGITVLNSPGTIDADYRGEIGVILYNSSEKSYEIKPSERIAQLVFARIVKVNFENSSALDVTERSSSGFGSTGTNWYIEKFEFLKIDKNNGKVLGLINFDGLRDKVKKHPELDVLNGIAYNKSRNTFFITGKKWNKVFEVKIIKD